MREADEGGEEIMTRRRQGNERKLEKDEQNDSYAATENVPAQGDAVRFECEPY